MLLLPNTTLLSQKNLSHYAAGDGSNWHYFNPDNQVLETHFFETFEDELGIGPSEMILYSSVFDSTTSITVKRYQQFLEYNPIEGANYLTYSKNNILLASHGRIANVSAASIPVLSVTEAREKAELEVSNLGSVFTWQDYLETLDVEGYDLCKASVSEAQFNGGQLMYAIPPHLEFHDVNNFVLAYKYTIETREPYNVHHVYINAVTNEVFKIMSGIENFDFIQESKPLTELAPNSNANAAIENNTNCACCNDKYGTAITWYNGIQALNVKRVVSNYRLRDCIRNIHTRDGFGSKPDEFKDNNGHWGTDDRNGTSAHWCTAVAWDYFNRNFYRKGLDNACHEIEVRIDDDFSAGFSTNTGIDVIGIGYANNGNSFASIEVIAHEYTHGINHYTSDLSSDEIEAGALNESFADIFGTVIEAEVQGSVDWLLGDEPGQIKGDMSRPRAYMDLDWISEGQPNYKHANAFVQNYWFYLVVNGGIVHGITVPGVGLKSASRIAYYALTLGLHEFATFEDSRNATILWANNLYGPCSQQAVAVTNAWAAVGVGEVIVDPCNDFEITLTIADGKDNQVCMEEYPEINRTFIATSTNNGQPVSVANYNWQYPTDKWNVSISGNRLTLISGRGPHYEFTGSSVTASATHNGQGGISNEIRMFSHKPCRISGKTMANELEQPITVVPNPSTGIFDISLTTDMINIEVYSYNGAFIRSIDTNSDLIKLDLNDLPNGKYLLKVTQANGKIASKIVVKQ